LYTFNAFIVDICLYSYSNCVVKTRFYKSMAIELLLFDQQRNSLLNNKIWRKYESKANNQFWNHCKNETVYWNVQKSRHIIHWKTTKNNNHIWPPKRSMIYVNWSKFKRNKPYFHFNFYLAIFCFWLMRLTFTLIIFWTW